MGDLYAHLHTLALLGLGLLGEQLVEEVEVRGLAARSLSEDGVEPLGDSAEAQPHQAFLDTSTNELTHDAPPIASTIAP